MEDKKPKTNLKFVIDHLCTVVNNYDPHHENSKTAMIKTSDFINALKAIAELKSLKKIKNISFKDDQIIEDITYDGEPEL